MWLNWSKKKLNRLYLDSLPVTTINSSLKSTIDVARAINLKVNIGHCIRGVEPNGNGFIITEEQAKEWILLDKRNL